MPPPPPPPSPQKLLPPPPPPPLLPPAHSCPLGCARMPDLDCLRTLVFTHTIITWLPRCFALAVFWLHCLFFWLHEVVLCRSTGVECLMHRHCTLRPRHNLSQRTPTGNRCMTTQQASPTTTTPPRSKRCGSCRTAKLRRRQRQSRRARRSRTLPQQSRQRSPCRRHLRTRLPVTSCSVCGTVRWAVYRRRTVR